VLTGYLLINKPKNITSYDCIRAIKKVISKKIKIGHAGTLDPFATGLLIICIGRQATKNISTLLNTDKTYLVKAKLGEITDTLDQTGELIKRDTSTMPTKQELESAIKSLGKEYRQKPPIYSALKHEGKPLYKLAREKKLSQEELEKIAESKSRTVSLHKIELLEYDPPYFTFIAHVSKGTYIRSLANDIAEHAGSCATTYELERTKIGDFLIEDAVELGDLRTVEDLERYLKSPH